MQLRRATRAVRHVARRLPAVLVVLPAAWLAGGAAASAVPAGRAAPAADSSAVAAPDSSAVATADSTSALVSVPVPSGPLLESWDGDEWTYEATPCAGGIAPALSRHEVNLLRHVEETRDRLGLRLRGTPGAIDNVDALTVFVVDHDRGRTILPDNAGWVRAVGPLDVPVRATDDSGADVLALVARADSLCWESRIRRRDPSATADLQDGIEAEFTRPLSASRANVVVDACLTRWAVDVLRSVVAIHGFETQPWFKAVYADTARAHRVSRAIEGGASLHVWVRGVDGWEWQGDAAEVAPDTPQPQAIPLDLSRVIGGIVRVRLTGIPDFWRIDRVGIDTAPAAPILKQEVRPEIVRQQRGLDVRGPLIAEDDSVYVIGPGDRVEMLFRVPPPSKGRERAFLSRTAAWYRPDSLSTAQPQRGLADELETGPDALARYSVTRMNAALAGGAPARSATGAR
jgi:hypothetical protein